PSVVLPSTRPVCVRSATAPGSMAQRPAESSGEPVEGRLLVPEEHFVDALVPVDVWLVLVLLLVLFVLVPLEDGVTRLLRLSSATGNLDQSRPVAVVSVSDNEPTAAWMLTTAMLRANRSR